MNRESSTSEKKSNYSEHRSWEDIKARVAVSIDKEGGFVELTVPFGLLEKEGIEFSSLDKVIDAALSKEPNFKTYILNQLVHIATDRYFEEIDDTEQTFPYVWFHKRESPEPLLISQVTKGQFQPSYRRYLPPKKKKGPSRKFDDLVVPLALVPIIYELVDQEVKKRVSDNRVKDYRYSEKTWKWWIKKRKKEIKEVFELFPVRFSGSELDRIANLKLSDLTEHIVSKVLKVSSRTLIRYLPPLRRRLSEESEEALNLYYQDLQDEV